MSSIAIILVCRNAVEDLQQTIDSVAAVDWGNKSFLVVDGNSDDGTSEVLRRNANVIDVCISEPDSGIYDAMNKGWQAARSDAHILYLGAGDTILSLPESDLKPSAVYYGDVLVGDRERFDSGLSARSRIGNTFHHQALLVPKQVHESPPFSLRYPVYGDFDFNLRLLKSEVPFERLEGFLAYAKPGGVSERLRIVEMARVVMANYGWPYAAVSVGYHLLYKIVKAYLSNRESKP